MCITRLDSRGLHWEWFVPASSFRNRVGLGWGTYYWLALINCFLNIVVLWEMVTLLHKLCPSSFKERTWLQIIVQIFVRLSTKLRVFSLRTINIEGFTYITITLIPWLRVPFETFWNCSQKLHHNSLTDILAFCGLFGLWKQHKVSQSQGFWMQCVNQMYNFVYGHRLWPKINKHVNYFWS